MIKKTLFIIIAITTIQSSKKNGTPAEKEMQNRVLTAQEESDILQKINLFTNENFQMKNSNFKLVLALKFQNESVKAGFAKSATKSFYKFNLFNDLKSCDFEFSKFSSADFMKNSEFLSQLNDCVPRKQDTEKLEDDSSEAQDLNQGTWVPETLGNSIMTQDQSKLILKILDLESFLNESGFSFKEGVFHTDLLLENEDIKRNTYRVTLENVNVECNFLIHDNENNKNTLSDDVKSQIRICGNKNSQKVSNFKNKKNNGKTSESNSVLSDSSEQEYPEINEFLIDLEDAFNAKAVEIEKNSNILDSYKPEFIENLENIYGQKLKNYQDGLMVKEDEIIKNLENKVQEIVLKKNEIEEELEQKNLDDQPHKNPEFLKKLDEILQKKNEEYNKNLNEEKRKKEDLQNKLKQMVQHLLKKTEDKIQKDEELIPTVEVLSHNKSLKDLKLSLTSESEENELPIIDTNFLVAPQKTKTNRSERSKSSQELKNDDENFSSDEETSIQDPNSTIQQKIQKINSNINKEKLNKHFLNQILINGQTEKCSRYNINAIKTLFNTLALQNKFQAIHLYDENFLECSSQVVSGMKYRAVMSFNDEKCVINLWHQAWMQNPVKVLYQGVQGNGVLANGKQEDIVNCADRVGTKELKDLIRKDLE